MRRFTLFVAFTILGVWLSLSLGGCAGPSLLEGSGIKAPAPGGYDDLCRRDPLSPVCPSPKAADALPPSH